MTKITSRGTPIPIPSLAGRERPDELEPGNEEEGIWLGGGAEVSDEEDMVADNEGEVSVSVGARTDQ